MSNIFDYLNKTFFGGATPSTPKSSTASKNDEYSFFEQFNDENFNKDDKNKKMKISFDKGELVIEVNDKQISKKVPTLYFISSIINGKDIRDNKKNIFEKLKQFISENNGIPFFENLRKYIDSNIRDNKNDKDNKKITLPIEKKIIIDKINEIIGYKEDLIKQEKERVLKEENDRKQKEENERKQKEENERKQKEENERKQKEENERKQQEENERKQQEENERKLKEENDKIEADKNIESLLNKSKEVVDVYDIILEDEALLEYVENYKKNIENILSNNPSSYDDVNNYLRLIEEYKKDAKLENTKKIIDNIIQEFTQKDNEEEKTNEEQSTVIEKTQELLTQPVLASYTNEEQSNVIEKTQELLTQPVLASSTNEPNDISQPDLTLIDDLFDKTRELLLVQIPDEFQSQDEIELIEGTFSIIDDNEKEIQFNPSSDTTILKTDDYIKIDKDETIFSFNNTYYQNIKNPIEFYYKKV